MCFSIFKSSSSWKEGDIYPTTTSDPVTKSFNESISAYKQVLIERILELESM